MRTFYVRVNYQVELGRFKFSLHVPNGTTSSPGRFFLALEVAPPPKPGKSTLGMRLLMEPLNGKFQKSG